MAKLPGRYYVPSAKPVAETLKHITHLGVAAHPDDLEIMAFHGILQSYHSRRRRFAGVVCANGAGGPRAKELAKMSQADYVDLRANEQEQAAGLGDYAALVQLGHDSADLLQPGFIHMQTELADVLVRMPRLEAIYTHALTDRHATHRATVCHVIKVLRQLKFKPKARVFGVEVWGSLDWLPLNQRVALDVSDSTNLQQRLLSCFRSQNQTGKRYDRAANARALANATFNSTHGVDDSTAIALAMDLTPLLANPKKCLRGFVDQLTSLHAEHARKGLAQVLERS